MLPGLHHAAMRGAPSAFSQETADARGYGTLTGEPCQSRTPAACRHPYPSTYDALTWLYAQTDARWLDDHSSCIRRFLSVLGWMRSRIVTTSFVDDTSASRTFTMAARRWLLAGAPAAMGNVWDRTHSAALAAPANKRQDLMGSEQGLPVLYDSWYDCVINYVRV